MKRFIVSDSYMKKEAVESPGPVGSKDTGAVPKTDVGILLARNSQIAIPESRYDLQILRSIRRVIRAVDIYSRKLKAGYRLTSPQLVCLTSITVHEPTTASRIAEDVFLSPSTVVGILVRLESKGLVIRERDVQDRRVVNIRSTEKGRRIVRDTPSPLQDNLSQSLPRLPLLEQAAIALSLEQVVKLMEAGHLEAAPILETDLSGLIGLEANRMPPSDASGIDQTSATKERSNQSLCR
jgi:DNA-binding MarR family transcriptional regulator